MKTESIKKDSSKSSNQLYKIKFNNDKSLKSKSKIMEKRTNSKNKTTGISSQNNSFIKVNTKTNTSFNVLNTYSNLNNDDLDILKEPQPEQCYFDTENNVEKSRQDKSKEKMLLRSEILNLKSEVSKLKKTKTNENTDSSKLNYLKDISQV